MKLLRVGTKGNEKPAILDKNGKIRDLSSQIKDLSPDNISIEILQEGYLDPKEPWVSMENTGEW